MVELEVTLSEAPLLVIPSTLSPRRVQKCCAVCFEVWPSYGRTAFDPFLPGGESYWQSPFLDEDKIEMA